MRKFGPFLAAGLALALLGACASSRDSVPIAEAARASSAPDWPQHSSDLPADPDIRFGTLPNGMRYAIMKSRTPPGSASLRLRIDAGSLDEQEDQRGLAHFIEHMVFNGTTNVPEGEFVKQLERLGLRFGPDTNASTGFDETVYMLDLPKADPVSIDTGLFLLREAAGEAAFDSASIERERGIILSEERTRAGPQMRTFEDEIGYLLKGDLLPNRVPIGLPEVIRAAPRDRFLNFYRGYYRPERTTLVAVGDFDVQAIETKIRAKFSDWRAVGAPAPDAPPSRITGRDTETRVFVEPGGPARISLTWVRPPDLRPDTRARRAERMITQLGLRIIGRRLQRIANSQSPPFIGASTGRSQIADRAEIVQILAVSRPGEWKKALESIEQERRRATEHGFTQAELNRELSEQRAAL
ncbi:MAG: M16 family metallopeptidase, partial [Allosphingosinicella sp.]